MPRNKVNKQADPRVGPIGPKGGRTEMCRGKKRRKGKREWW